MEVPKVPSLTGWLNPLYIHILQSILHLQRIKPRTRSKWGKRLEMPGGWRQDCPFQLGPQKVQDTSSLGMKLNWSSPNKIYSAFKSIKRNSAYKALTNYLERQDIMSQRMVINSEQVRQSTEVIRRAVPGFHSCLIFHRLCDSGQADLCISVFSSLNIG